MKSVKTVVVAQRMNEFIDVFAQWIRDAGYDVRVCTGPSDGNDCWANTPKGCPLWNLADLMVYDPWIASSYGGGTAFQLERQRHPDTPILVWGNGAVPKDVADMVGPGDVELLPPNIGPKVLVSAIERMIGPPSVGIPWKVDGN